MRDRADVYPSSFDGIFRQEVTNVPNFFHCSLILWDPAPRIITVYPLRFLAVTTPFRNTENEDPGLTFVFDEDWRSGISSTTTLN